MVEPRCSTALPSPSRPDLRGAPSRWPAPHRHSSRVCPARLPAPGSSRHRKTPSRPLAMLFLLLLWPLEAVLSSSPGAGTTITSSLDGGSCGAERCAAGSRSSRRSTILPGGDRSPLQRSWWFSWPALVGKPGEYQQTFQRLAFGRQQGIEIDHPVAAYLRQHTRPQDTVLVWGARLALQRPLAPQNRPRPGCSTRCWPIRPSPAAWPKVSTPT